MKYLLYEIFIIAVLQFAYTSQQTERHKVVRIGAIFFDDEFDLVDAFDTAVSDINGREFADVTLEPLKHFLSEDDSVTLQELTCDLIGNGVAAIFGPSSKTKSDIVAVLCNITGIPHLQFDWHGQDNEQHRRNHQMTVNVAPCESQIAVAFWDILRNKDFDWKSFSIVYESDENLGRMQNLLAWKQLAKSGIKMWKFKRGDDYRIIWKLLSNAREKLVVLDCPADIVRDVVNASMFYNMTGMFNKLFLTNLDTQTSHIDDLYSKDFLAAISAVKLRPYMPPPVHDEVDVFSDPDEEKLVSLQQQLIYDAVILHYTAIRNIIRLYRYDAPRLYCGDDEFWRPGPNVLQQMKNITSKTVAIPFKTQKFKLNEFGEREDFNLEVYNPMTDTVTHVWNKDKKLMSIDEISEVKQIKQRKQVGKKDFSQVKLRYTVSSRFGEPYFMWRKEPEGVHYEGNERFEGYAVDLIYKLGNKLQFDFTFEPVPDNNYGSYDSVKNEWNGIIRELIDNKAQMGICDLTITQKRRSVIDFTVPFMQLGVSILHYKEKPPKPNQYKFFNAYTLDVWMHCLVALMVITFGMVFIARLSQADWEMENFTGEEPDMHENIWNLFNAFWLTIGSILTQGCDLLPRGLAPRLFTAFWWIFALLIAQTYIAQLAAFITSSKMENKIKDLNGLVDQDKVQYGTVKGGSTSLLFSESNETVYRLAWNKMTTMKPDAFTASNKEGVDRVALGKGNYAFLMETTNLQYYLQHNCDLTQIGEPFGVKHYGIGVPMNAPYRSNLSWAILKLSEKGELLTLKRKWFNNASEECGSDSAEENKPAGMDSLGGIFMILIYGILVSICIACFELLWHVEQIAVEEKLSYIIVLKAELKFFIRFWLDRKPLKTYLVSRGSTSTGYSSFEQSSSTASVKKKKRNKSKMKSKSRRESINNTE